MAALRAVAPFEAVTLLAWIAVLVGTTIDWPAYVVSTGLIVLVGTLPLTNWRAVRFGTAPSALLYLAAVALLRDSAGGLTSGVGMLSLVPVFYVALYGTRRTLAIVIAGVAVFYLAPVILIGPPAYPTSQYRIALLSVAVGAIIGLTTQSLVGRVKLAGKEAREQRRMLEAVTDLVRNLGSGPMARAEVCEAARTIGEAGAAMLYEPVAGGALRSTAVAGMEADPVELLPGEATILWRCFSSGERILLTDDVEARVGSPELWAAAGGPTSILYEPLMQGSEVVGVLTVGWNDEVKVAGPRATVIALLAHEVAAVIARSDKLGKLSTAAETDPLTGLPNRRAWDERIRRAFDEHDSVIIAILDLDHFKLYNDTFGHPAGDLLLKETAAAWAELLRGDFLARIGGEEFGLLLVGCDATQATAVADRLRTHVTQGQTCSVGFAVRAAGESVSAVMGRADAALYEAKDGGRDRVSIAGASPIVPPGLVGPDGTRDPLS